jgi:glycerol-3-phosphate O-acyltransferase
MWCLLPSGRSSATLNHFTRRRAWPNPFQDGYFLKTLQDRRGSLLFLVDQVGFRQRFLKPREDPIRHLLELQEQLDFPIFLVPQMVIYEKAPLREDKGLLQLFFGDVENPGKLRKLVLCFFKAKRAVVEVAEPVNLQEALAAAPEYAVTMSKLPGAATPMIGKPSILGPSPLKGLSPPLGVLAHALVE